jgi:predicted outer membrane protein
MPEDCPAACASRRPARSYSAVRRWQRLTNVLVVGTLVVLSIGWLSSPGQHAALGSGVAAAAPASTDTSWGPLTASDRDLLVRVRLAGLWEIPMGTQAQTQAASPRVKEVGRLLAADHRRLDEQVRQLARKLQVPLPDQPNSDQRGWMAELSGLRGEDFDVAFANRLRVAHGRVFTVVSEARAATRNAAVRPFAQTAVDVVMRHMSLLESTGLVAPTEAHTLAPPAPRGPITTPLVVTLVGLVAVANLAVAARRSWS